ncbi:MAG: hypothetical protein BM485_11945 [Desulfobulbaceae bacterium DB1]|nr:MAG: hypothetical protein BM485_11945 [Desulfobulbaceae bacterium DB1]
MRTCLVCGNQSAKDSLLRLTARNGFIVVDEKQVRDGRGSYCCKRNECIAGLRKRIKRLNKALHIEGFSLGGDVPDHDNCCFA